METRKMATLTIGSVCYEIVDRAARESLDKKLNTSDLVEISVEKIDEICQNTDVLSASQNEQ